ncbi:MAG: M23 family metallopeptidase [Deltaproteobacteria bacterium]|nr:M23 family metallopeptidase [Deltaproteobacteria bacterium]
MHLFHLLFIPVFFISVFFTHIGCKDRIDPIKAEYNRPLTLSQHDTIKKDIYKEPIGPLPDFMKIYGNIEDGETLSLALLRAGVEYKIAEQIILNLRGIFDFRKCKAGDTFVVSLDRDTNNLLSFEYSSSPIESYIIESDEDGNFVAYKEEYEIEKRVEFVTGRISGSLYETMERIGEDPQLSIILANEVFAWDIDFYTEVMPDDEFKIVVEKYYSGNYFVQYGNILAASYNGKVTGSKEAFYFVVDKKGGYYNSKGLANKRAFLKSPLKYGKISSGFGKRRHPIYKRIKMHHGVDYAAPIGTQVWAVADGVVTFAGVMGGYGNLVIIKHKGGLETRYGHLSRFGAGIRQGVSVEQGRLIGYVGSTGVSTGPHLHFEMRHNGKIINPLKKVAPPTEPLDKRYMSQFLKMVEEYRKYFQFTESKVISVNNDVGSETTR